MSTMAHKVAMLTGLMSLSILAITLEKSTTGVVKSTESCNTIARVFNERETKEEDNLNDVIMLAKKQEEFVIPMVTTKDTEAQIFTASGQIVSSAVLAQMSEPEQTTRQINTNIGGDPITEDDTKTEDDEPSMASILSLESGIEETEESTEEGTPKTASVAEILDSIKPSVVLASTSNTTETLEEDSVELTKTEEETSTSSSEEEDSTESEETSTIEEEQPEDNEEVEDTEDDDEVGEVEESASSESSEEDEEQSVEDEDSDEASEDDVEEIDYDMSEETDAIQADKVTDEIDYFTAYTDLMNHRDITDDEMNYIIDNFVSGRNSSLTDTGDAFIKASQQTGYDPIFLLCLAGQESSWTVSELHTSKNNPYSINMTDDNPHGGYNMGDSWKDGIVNGASWIKQKYYDNGQCSAHTMIYGKKCYSSSKDFWISSLVSNMNKCYRLLKKYEAEN